MTTFKPRQFKKKQKLRNNEYYDMQKKYDELYERSQKGDIFKNLLNLICDANNILEAYRNIKNNKGSTTIGVNSKTIKDIGEKQSEIIINYVRNRLENFKPHKVRRVEIPKPNGKTRPLGIPTIEDRLIQQSIKQILEPICEAKFHKHSYGFRPNRSTHHAITRAMYLVHINKLHYVVDIDIKGFFDNINHGKLLKQIWSLGIRDKKLICILSKMLKAEIKGIGKPVKGTPQGGIISPILSNIALNELDWWISDQWQTFETSHKYTNTHKFRALKTTKMKEMYIVRYADDFKVFCKDYKSAQKIFIAVKSWLKERLGLDISPEKSKVINLRKNYSNFLGFKLKVVERHHKGIVQSHISDKAAKIVQKTIKQKIRDIRNSPTVSSVTRYNQTILGIHNYYSRATKTSYDFRKIAFLVSRYLYNQTRRIRSNKGVKTQAFMQYYGKYNIRTVYIANIALYPINGITLKENKSFPNKVCNYTEEGRKYIHQSLSKKFSKTLRYLLNNPIKHGGTELNDNRISRFIGQNGRCGVTGEALEIADMKMHHVIPKHKVGSDKYSNLILVNSSIDKLIHAKSGKVIAKYCKELPLDETMLEKLNELRLKVGNCVI
ncbi:group II intron reverse transcriptase/maturase [Clostridium oryzae]|uniref:Group II intron-encoded protein LtrA n=1 Tax=Clostridium oryzae TaxID=1450648 RepID=A0A1V4IKW2_9CLOT|nr:group II intron reverse transcriptase/maturase [Clostridium oryzae]OPJ60672.1 group II intron-encoded protein LtrA [Clostridium oryzae]